MSRHPFLVQGRPDVLAHRGASADKPPGNHRSAFARAVESGTDHVETDVQATSDGRIAVWNRACVPGHRRRLRVGGRRHRHRAHGVVFHDETLDDATTGAGAIEEHTWSELADVRYVVDGEPIDDGLVLLNDVLALWPDTFFNIDVKTDAAVEPTVEILRRAGARERVCVAAFGWRRLRRLRRQLGSGWCTAFSRIEIVAARVASWLHLPVPRFGDVVQVPREQKSVSVVDERFVSACHRRDIAVHVWTVNDPTEMRRLQQLGVDALITDRPDRSPTTEG